MGDVESSPDREQPFTNDAAKSPTPDKSIVIVESGGQDEVISTPDPSHSPPNFELNVRRSSQALSDLGSSIEFLDPEDAFYFEPAGGKSCCSPPLPLVGTLEENAANSYQDEMEEDPIPLQFPLGGLPPRTIPFRSASFSQVETTADVNNPRSPITLKPTAFCLLNKQGPLGGGGSVYASGSSTLPRPTTTTSTTTTSSTRADDHPSITPRERSESESSGINTLASQPPTQADEGSQTPTLISLKDSENSLVSEMKESEVADGDCKEMAAAASQNQNLGQESLGVVQSYTTTSSESAGQNSDPDPTQEGKADMDNRVNFTLGGDEEPLELIRTTVNPEDSGDFTARIPSPEGLVNVVEGGEVECGSGSDILGLAQGNPSLDPNPSNQSSGAGSTSSTSGGDTESDAEKGQLLRQSSGQSDGSDDAGVLNASDQSCSSPTPPRTLGAEAADPPKLTKQFSESKPHYSPASPPLINKKEMTRAHSVSTTRYTWGRYNKRLRGPYGEMLEAEMNKLIPRRTAAAARDLDNFEFFRESKSSSPNRSSNSHSNSPESGIHSLLLQSSNLSAAPSGSGSASSSSSKKLTSLNPLLMSSMDDLNLTSKLPKHSNPRSRKISANLPVQPSHYSSETASPLVFLHQRTASSPSQLLYTTSTTSPPSSSSTSSISSTSFEQNRRLLRTWMESKHGYSALAKVFTS